MVEKTVSDIDTSNTKEKTVDIINQDVVTETTKTFTQDDINRIISERLKKYQDYDELVSFKQTSEEAKLSELEKMQKKIDNLSVYEKNYKDASETLESMLQKQIESIDESKRTLIPDNFSVIEKLKYINQNSSYLLSHKVDIRTPDNKFGSTESTNPNLLYGKYSSVEEFAAKDLKGFNAAIKTKGYLEELKRVGIITE